MAAAKTESSYIQYFVPCDGDNEECVALCGLRPPPPAPRPRLTPPHLLPTSPSHPNVFMVRKPPKQLTLGDVTAQFPLPGAYLFRAKVAMGKSHGAWARPHPSRARARAASPHHAPAPSPPPPPSQCGWTSAPRTSPCPSSPTSLC